MLKKHSESNTTKKSSKDSKKKFVGFESMSGLKQGERYSTKPEDFQSEIQVKATFRYKKVKTICFCKTRVVFFRSMCFREKRH